MIDAYNNLRQKYHLQGYEDAYNYITELEQKNSFEEIVLVNFYSYITIQSEFKAEQILELLQSCLQQQQENMQKISKSTRALTLYHITSVYFKSGKYQVCLAKCQLIIQEFIGLYYSLDKRLQRKGDEQVLRVELQQILYYVFMMMGYICKQENKLQNSTVYADAGRRILKDRKDVLSLTTKTELKSNPTTISDGSVQQFEKEKEERNSSKKKERMHRQKPMQSSRQTSQYPRAETCITNFRI